MKIQERSMLVDLTIKCWDATKHDKKVSAEVEQTHAAHDAGRYSKRLIDKAHLAELSALASKARQFHYSYTLPWSDKGQRILPSDLFIDYRQGIQNIKNEYMKARDTFLAKYPQLVQDARVRLGTMYDPADYPAPENLSSAFDITTEIMPVPDAFDFRVNVDSETQDAIRAQITEAVMAKQAKAVKDCWIRAREVLERIAVQCGNTKGRIHDSLMDNAYDLVKVLKGLNITNDPQVAQMEKDISALIVPTTAIRVSQATRKRVADGAANILAYMPGA
jgi:hypothetical protein